MMIKAEAGLNISFNIDEIYLLRFYNQYAIHCRLDIDRRDNDAPKNDGQAFHAVFQ